MSSPKFSLWSALWDRFSHPRVGRLVRRHDLDGLISALSFQRGTPSSVGIRVRCEAAKALGRIPLHAVIPPLIASLDDEDVAGRARVSLEMLTYEHRLGRDRARWLEWWNANKSDPRVLRRVKEIYRDTQWGRVKDDIHREVKTPVHIESLLRQRIAGDYHGDTAPGEEEVQRWNKQRQVELEPKLRAARQKLEEEWQEEDRWIEKWNQHVQNRQ